MYYYGLFVDKFNNWGIAKSVRQLFLVQPCIGSSPIIPKSIIIYNKVTYIVELVSL